MSELSRAVPINAPTRGGSGAASKLAEGTTARSFGHSVEHVGSLVRFSLALLRDIPVAARHYPSEVVRQAGMLIRANYLVVLLMLFLIGAILSITTSWLFATVGIESFIGSFPAVVMRGLPQAVFGWIVAAKVGCGIVAEIGAMRINEEIDAMEVMGIRSRAYLASTRVLAGLVVIPFLWFVALAVNFTASYLMLVQVLEVTSSGQFFYTLFLFQNLQDFVIALVWALLIGMIVFVVSCYYGYTATGGPVGVGRATANSMLLNLVLISLVAMVLMQLFYGNQPNAPLAN